MGVREYTDIGDEYDCKYVNDTSSVVDDDTK